jgi:dTDP-4-dehydrorhamnose 3,5-epimerase-like enzyme
MLYVPRGVAHGFRVLSSQATILYLVDQIYNAEFDFSINPLSIGYDWGLSNPILSLRDKQGIELENYILRDCLK